MKIPKLSAGNSIDRSSRITQNRREEIAPMLDLSCILKCGAAALGCVLCGPNPACWLLCAGPAAFTCIKECL
ncbi:MAG TPA: hypothetical protein VHI13_08515 [Candidatus Kapabacteria bacterium]|nr:hypothetical protein [Candidatus Kapabacteria bacterium]